MLCKEFQDAVDGLHAAQDRFQQHFEKGAVVLAHRGGINEMHFCPITFGREYFSDGKRCEAPNLDALFSLYVSNMGSERDEMHWTPTSGWTNRQV